MKTVLKMKLVNTSLLALAMPFGATIAPAIAHAAEAAEAAEAADSSAPAAGEILVTARKREESLLKVPVAVSALTGDDIAARGITTVADVAANTPGVNVASVNSGRNDRSFQQISLRGMTPSTTSSTLTASFIDGVPVASATALANVTDPARVEVLKGPQNAYFGRNAFAGAINVVNKVPGNEFAGSFSASVANRSNYDLQGSIEAPIIKDVLGFRLAGRTFRKNGSYINAANPAQTLGDQQTSTFSGLVVFKPVSGLAIKGYGMYSEDHDGPSAQGLISAYEIRSNNGAVNIPALSGNSNGTVIVANQSNCTLSGFATGIAPTEARIANPFICGAAPRLSAFSPAQNTVSDLLLNSKLTNGASRFISGTDGVQGYGLKRKYVHLHLNIDYELGDTGITLSSLTGYNNEYYSELADLDNYDSSKLVNTAATTANGNRAFFTFPFLVERRNKDFSQELRASYDKGPLRAMIGGSYLKTNVYNDLVSIFNEEQFGLARAASSLSPPSKSITKGVFGSLSYAFTDQLTLAAEGRYQQDEIFAFAGGRTLVISQAIATQYGVPAGTFQPLQQYFSKKYNNFLPRVIINFQATPDLMIYGSWSRAANVSIGSFNTAFLAGSAGEIAAAQAINLSVVTQPEKLSNFEIGVKGKLLNNRVRFSLAAYAANWTNQYNNRTSIFVDPTTKVAAIVSGVANSGRTLLKGFEADFTAEPVDGLTVNLSGSVNDSNIRSFADPSISKLTGVIGDGFIGNQLPLTSKYSAVVGAQYKAALPGVEDGSFFLRGDMSYKSKQFVDAANLTWIKGRAVVNARLGFAKGSTSIEFFANNLFNDRNYISVAQNNLLEPSFALSSKAFGYLNVALPELRSYGVKVGYKF